MSQKNIFLLLGSNQGDRASHIAQGVESIEKEIGIVINQSTIYETAAWGKQDQPHFLNQAIQVETTMSPADLLSEILAIEKSMGRHRAEKWGARIIDIDIIYFGDKIIDRPDLVVPHPHLTERKFVLIPLVEISPDFIHPRLKKSNADLLKECKDPLRVTAFTN